METLYTVLKPRLRSDMKTIVKLSMNNCAPCKQYAPTFKKVAKEFPDYLWDELDVTDSDLGCRLAVDLKIRSVPATVMYDSNDITDTKVKLGIMTEQQLKEFILDD